MLGHAMISDAGPPFSGFELLSLEIVVPEGTTRYPPTLGSGWRDLSARWGSICSVLVSVGSFDVGARTGEQGPPLLLARGIGNVGGRR